MSRYTGPRQRINRRFGLAIFPASKAFERKPFFPGQHGPTGRRKEKEYGTGLLEKQKLRLTYGLAEKQFRNTFERAKHIRGVTGTVFLQLLECRLHNVVYRLGFSKTRAAARQFVGHGHIKVNGHRVNVASASVNPGDKIEVRGGTSSRQLATRNLEESRGRVVPGWLTVQEDILTGTVVRLPEREEMEQQVNEQLVVEFYSR